MRKVVLLVPLCALVMGMSLCSEVREGVEEEIYQALADNWKDENPGQEPSLELQAQFRAQAKAEAKKYLAEQDKKAIKHGTDVVTGAATGNWILAVLGGIGLIGVGGGVYAKYRKGKKGGKKS